MNTQNNGDDYDADQLNAELNQPEIIEITDPDQDKI